MWVLLFTLSTVAGLWVSSSSQEAQRFWVPDGRATRSVVAFRLVLHAQRPDELRDVFLRVSDPRSPAYASYLTVEELCRLVRPSAERRTRLDLFLRSNNLNVTQHGACDDFLTVSAQSEDVERAFQTSLFRYVEKGNRNHSIVAAPSGLRIPPELVDVVELVHGVHFPVPLKQSRRASSWSASASSSYADATPPVIAKLCEHSCLSSQRTVFSHFSFCRWSSHIARGQQQDVTSCGWLAGKGVFGDTCLMCV
jgi:subtilase family serine protease